MTCDWFGSIPTLCKTGPWFSTHTSRDGCRKGLSMYPEWKKHLPSFHPLRPGRCDVRGVRNSLPGIFSYERETNERIKIRKRMDIFSCCFLFYDNLSSWTLSYKNWIDQVISLRDWENSFINSFMTMYASNNVY